MENNVYIDFNANMELFNKEVNRANSYLQQLQTNADGINKADGFDKAAGDVKKLNTQLGKTEGQIEEVERSIKEWQQASKRATNTKDLGRYNRNIEEAQKELKRLKTVGTTSMRAVNNETKRTSTTMSMLGKRVKQAFGVAMVLAFARGIARAGQAAIKAHDIQAKKEKQLLTALKGRKDITDRLIKQAAQLQSVTVFGDEEIIDAQSQLAKLLGNNEDAIKKLTPLVLDFATIQGVDLKTAADLVAKSVASGTNALSRYGIVIEGAVGSNERLDSAVNALTKSMGGQAEAAAKAGSGSLTQLGNVLGDIQEKMGGVLLRGIKPLIKGFSDFAKRLNIDMEVKQNIANIEDERDTLIGLVATLEDTNSTEEERNKAIGELNRSYPEILKNIDTENINYTVLNENLDTYLNNVIKRIALESLMGEQQKVLMDYSNAKVQAINSEVDALNYINQVMGSDASLQKYIVTQGSIKEQLDGTISNLYKFRNAVEYANGSNVSGTGMPIVGQENLTKEAVAYKRLVEFAMQYTKNQNEANQIKKDELPLIQQKIAALNEELGTLLAVGGGSGGGGGAVGAVMSEYEKLTSRIGELNKAVLEQVTIQGYANNRTIQELKLLQERLDLINEIADVMKTDIPEIEIKLPTKLDGGDVDVLPLITTYTEEFIKGMENVSGEYKGMLGAVLSDMFYLNKDELLDKGKELLNNWVSESQRANEAIIKSNEDRVNSLKGDLDREIELKKLGLRNNIEGVQAEIEATQRAQQQALKKKEQLAKQEKIINNISTASNLVAANAEMIKTATGFGPLAPIIAVGLIAAVMTIFQNAASKAGSLTFAKGDGAIMGGRSHAEGGNPILWNGQVATAERGEFQGIASKTNTAKYGDGLITLFKGMRKNDDPLMISGITDLLDNIDTTTVFNAPKGEYRRGDLKNIEKALSNRQLEGNGYREVKVGNTTRRIRNV